MGNPVITKQPHEVIRFGVDFVDRLALNDTIITSLSTISVVESLLGTDASSMVSSIAINSVTVLSALVAGGTTATKYKLTYVITTTGLEILEQDLDLKVKEN
jgi:hypothetical protein